MPVIGSIPGPAPDHHAGYQKIIENKKILVQENKNMIVFQELEIEGELDIEGEVIVIT